MTLPDKEWYTMEELANIWDTNYSRVQRAVFTLVNLGNIKTRRSPQDSRATEIHKESLDLVKRAIFGA